MLNLMTLIEESTPKISNKNLIEDFSNYLRQGYDKNQSDKHIQWILRFTQFHNHQHPLDLNHSDISAFLSALAIEQQFDAKLQCDAFHSLTILYRDFLKHPIGQISYQEIKKRKCIADQLDPSVRQAIINRMQGSSQLMAQLLVAGQLKLKEVVNIRVTDINIKANRIAIRDQDDKIKYLIKIPLNLNLDLRIQVMRIKQLIRVKASQFSKGQKTQYNPTPESLISIKRKPDDEFLFPVASIDNPQQSSLKMQLALLKNDITIAYHQYLRANSAVIRLPKMVKIKQQNNLSKTMFGQRTKQIHFTQRHLDFMEQGAA